MKNLTSIVSGISLMLLVTACGGGGDDAPAAATTGATAPTTTAPTTTTPGIAAPVVTTEISAQLSSLAGTWVGCSAEGTSSERESIVFTQLSADTFSAVSTSTKFSGPGCAGAVTRTSSASGMLTFSGTKTIGAESVNKFIFTQAGSAPQKDVALVKGSNPVTLTFGKDAQDGGVMDSDGYPTTLQGNGSGTFTKQ